MYFIQWQKVCKSGDIPSCSDNRTEGRFLGKACYRATITEVVNGCNDGNACEGAGRDGDLRRVVNGCHGGLFSCTNAASEGGYIKEIVDSCIGQSVCGSAARGGNIGSITNGFVSVIHPVLGPLVMGTLVTSTMDAED